MRALWMPSPLAIFKPNVGIIGSALPEAVKVSFTFPDKTAFSRTSPEVASEMAVHFRNGTTLTVPGHMLWRFRDMIPAQLGDEQSGYTDTNPFSPEHGSALMERVRRAHDAAYGLRDSTPGLFDKILLSATIDLVSRKVTRVERPSLSPSVCTDLALQFMSIAADHRKQTVQAMATIVEQETSRPRLRLEANAQRGGYVSREKTRSPWPDLEALLFRTYRNELSETTWPGSPAQMQQKDLLDQVLLSEASRLFLRLLKHLKGEPIYFMLCRELHLPPTEGPQRVATAIAKTDFEFVPPSLLWADSTRILGDCTVADMLRRKSDTYWLGLNADDRFRNTPEERKQPIDHSHLSQRIAYVMHTNKSGRRKVFRMVCKLWVFPDIRPSRASEAPYITHSALNLERLRLELQAALSFGPPARIRVANDTVYIAVTAVRHGQESLSCNDFASLLLERSRKTDEAVIGVQQAWHPLHEFKHSDHCPPPQIIMFVAETYDFEDAMQWLDQSRMVLGISGAMHSMLEDEPPNHIGKLPDTLQQTLHAVFGVKFEARCMLDRGPTDLPPPLYRRFS